MVKKNKSERSNNFKADIKTIKNEDVRKLQETFSQFFGVNPSWFKIALSSLTIHSSTISLSIIKQSAITL